MNSIGESSILSVYRNNGIFARLHVWLRLKTCPFSLVEKFIPAKGVVMDYGCGHGIFAHMLYLASSSRKIYGVDISAAKLNEARKACADNTIQFLCGDKESIKPLLTQLDCLVMLDVLCYFKEKEKREALVLFYEGLKPGASLIIKDIRCSFSVKFIWLYLQEILAVKLLRITKARSLSFFSIEYLSNLLKDIGFDVDVLDLSGGYAYPHVLYICRK